LTGDGTSPPPRNVRDLQKALAAESKREGALVGRIQRRLGAIVVAEMLTRVDLGTEGPPLLVKGGSALELRLGLAESRTSKDLDAVVRGSIATFMDQAAEAVAQPLAGFTGKVEKVAEIAVPGMDPRPRQFLVKLAYEGKPFSTITVELSPPEGRAAIEYDEVQTPSLAGIGLDDRPVIACLTVKYQIAQKLHACTHQRDDGVANDRARDLVDILLLEPLLDELPVGDVKAACVDTFTVRGGHAWPPHLLVPPAWASIYAAAAVGLESRVPADVVTAAELVRALIVRIDLA